MSPWQSSQRFGPWAHDSATSLRMRWMEGLEITKRTGRRASQTHFSVASGKRSRARTTLRSKRGTHGSSSARTPPEMQRGPSNGMGLVGGSVRGSFIILFCRHRPPPARARRSRGAPRFHRPGMLSPAEWVSRPDGTSSLQHATTRVAPAFLSTCTATRDTSQKCPCSEQALPPQNHPRSPCCSTVGLLPASVLAVPFSRFMNLR